MSLVTRPTVICLSENERERLRCFASETPYPNAGSYDRFVIASRHAAASALDHQTLLQLDALKNAFRPPAPLVIENVPFDLSLVRGPIDPTAAHIDKPDSLSEGVLVGIVALVGEPYAVCHEGQGLVSNVAARQADAMRTTGLGSRVELGLHIENAAARVLEGDRAPDGLALIGVSAELGEAPGTMLADGRLALQLVGEACERVLRDPAARFAVKVPERWREASGGTISLRTPLLIGPSAAPSIIAAFYGDMIEAVDAEAREALETFRDALTEVAVDVVVRPGNLVLIDNHFVLHGRRPFPAKFDETGRPYRWLQRVFYTSSLRRFREWPRHRGRVIEPVL